MEKHGSTLKIIIDKPAARKPLRRSRRRCKGNTRIDLKEVSVYRRKWIDSEKDRNYWNAAFNLRIPQAKELVC